MAGQDDLDRDTHTSEHLFFGPLAGNLFVSLSPDGGSARYFYPTADGRFEEVSAEESAERTRAFFEEQIRAGLAPARVA